MTVGKLLESHHLSVPGSLPPQSNKTSFVLDLNHSSPFFSRSASCSLMQSRQRFLAAAAHAVKSMLFSASGIKNTTLPNTRYLPTSRNTTECYTPLRVMTGRSHPRQGVTAFGDWCSAAEARLLSRPAPGGWRQVMPRGNLLSPGKASTACSLSEQGGKGTSLFSIFTKCKSVKPLMACHLDGNCSPFRGRQVKGRACGCSPLFFFFLQVLMWKAFSLSGDYCHICV